jgi:hypothetical protein
MSQTTPPPGDETATAYNRLRRLQEHSRSNIPAVMTHRSTSTFTLHDEPLPAEATDRVLLVVYPQDPFIGEPEIRTMSANDIRPGLINNRVRVEAASPLAQPDAEGNYLFWPGDPRFDQVNVFYFTTLTLRMYERYAQRALPWAFPAPRLTVVPHVGEQANAFYNEQDRQLGFHAFQLDGEPVSTAHSADIIGHEAAHAVLDGLRDLYNESFGLGPAAFHEAFSDVTAMLIALHDDSLVRRLLDWTKGDLRTDNFVVEIAEHVIDALSESDDMRLQAHNIYLRKTLNTFKLVPFEELVREPDDPEFTLGRQPHNYSRLLSGTFYDIFSGIYEKLRQTTPDHIAIYRARDIAARLLIFTIEIGPVGEFDFADWSRCMLAAESILFERRYQSVLIDTFAQRGLLSPDASQAALNAMTSLPGVHLPESINSAMASALFLEDAILPALQIEPGTELIPMAAYRNATGYAFLTYFQTERITLDDAAFGMYQGASLDLFGGLSVVFDPAGVMRHAFYRPVNSTDKAQVGVMVQDLIQMGLISEKFYISGTLKNRLPEGLRLANTQVDRPGDSQLIKYPIMFDEFPLTKMDIIAYFRRLKDKIRP